MSTRVIEVTGEKDVSAAARQAAKALREGQLVGFATETVYGIAAMATIAETMERLRELKSRPKRPFSVHVGKPGDARRYVKLVPDSARRLMNKAWPGPVTLLVPTGGRLADAKLRRRAGLYDRLCAKGIIGLRCPDEPLARAMLGQVSLPVVAPSANLTGGPSPCTAEDVLAALDGRIDLLIDSGPTRYGMDSTIVRCDESGWRVVREGVWDAAAIRRMWERTLLFVCTGNTCRSPVAEGLAKKLLAERLDCEVRQLPHRGVKVLSAGAFGLNGARATPAAVRAADELGADISKHHSRILTRELIKEADVVFCMTDSHIAEVVRLVPDAAEKVRKLDARGDVADPIGGGPVVYRRTARRIERAIRTALSKGLP